MNNAGLMRIGAMLAMLAVLTGAFAALPYWNARAADKTVWGFVDECNPASPGPSFLPNVVVSLIDAHGISPTVNTSTSSDGHYMFTPATGSYLLRFAVAEHYYNKTVYPFRFDGSTDLNINACLFRMPPRTLSLTVLVVDQMSAAHLNEQLDNRFFRIPIPFTENIAGTVNTGTGLATVTHHPVMRPGYSVTWRDPPAGTVPLSEPAGYIWPDLFNGTIQITDATVLASLQAGRGGKWLNVSYQYSGTTVRLLSPPVASGPPYTVAKNGASWMARENVDWKLDLDTATLSILQNFVFGTDNLFINYSSTGAVANASVSLYNTTAKQEVAQGLTSSTGFFTFSIWAASLQLRAVKEQYQSAEVLVDASVRNTTRVMLPNAVQVFGLAKRSDRSGPVNTNVIGFLYNRAAVSDFKKVVAAKVSGSLYQFYVEPSQSYRMVIDADGYKAVETLVTSPGSGALRVDTYLTPSLREEYRTIVEYDHTNWSRVNISRKFVLRPDSTIPGLDLPGIRSLGLQIDYTIGNRDGVLQTTELNGLNNSFQWWLGTRLADYVTTDSFLTTNGLVYNSSAIYTVDPITYSPSLANPVAFYVNTTASYTLKTPPIVKNGKITYYVNVTTPNDRNETVYQDHVVEVRLPLGYEMTQKKVTGPITTTGWTRVTVDPGLGTGTSTIDMTVHQSRNGTARAMVAGPSGKFYVYDDTLKNYTAIVAADTNITFSAEQSTDPVGSIRDANFTWRFTNNTDRLNPRRIGYNITSPFNYSTAVLGSVPPPGHFFVVNLTITEAGGNLTYRDIKVYVDDTPPVALIKTNRTAGRVANNLTLRVNEDIPIKYDGTTSFDIAYVGALAWLNSSKNIPDLEGRRGYRWDFEGKHIVSSNLKAPTHAFDTPGYYNTTLQVMDWVGHNSTINATLHVIANDTTKPTPNFVILDPSKDWTVTTSLIEGKNYSFNASTSKDNFDSNRNLSYAWHFPGPVTCTPACLDGNISRRKGYDGVTWGWNVTVLWAVFNVSYNVTLNVTDTGFLGRTPNFGNLTTAVHVSVDTAKHPDLKYVGQSLKIEPNQVEEGQMINVSFMISNEANRANATAVTITLTAKDSSGAVVLVATNPDWRDTNWKSLPISNHTIATGAKVRIIFMISFPAQGNKSLDIRFYDAREPYTWVGENRVTGTVFVKLAGWVIPAAIIGFIAVVIGVAYGARTYSRYRSGELVFRRKEKKEKKKLEDKEEAEEEEPEPEEDTKAKKRL